MGVEVGAAYLTGLARAQIHKLGSQYVLYYTASDRSGVLSIGVATSANVHGPFEDVLAKPLLRHYGNDPLGVIDPSMVVHDGVPHLIWKDDGNAVGMPTPIWIQELAGDGLSLKGNPHLLISNDASSWEGGVVEGPWMLHRQGYYYLFYSVRTHPLPPPRFHKRQRRAPSLFSPRATAACAAGQYLLRRDILTGRGA